MSVSPCEEGGLLSTDHLVVRVGTMIWISIYVHANVRFRRCHCQNKVSVLITVSDDQVEHAEQVALTIVHKYYVHLICRH